MKGTAEAEAGKSRFWSYVGPFGSAKVRRSEREKRGVKKHRATTAKPASQRLRGKEAKRCGLDGDGCGGGNLRRASQRQAVRTISSRRKELPGESVFRSKNA